MQKQLTQGPVMPTMLRFAVPMILGDLLQQCYNIADTLVVGRFIGTNALAAVGSAFTLMTFLTSILLGLAMGSGTVFSIKFGQKDDTGLREGVLAAFVLLAIVTAVLTGAVYLGFEGIIWFLRLPAEIAPLMRTYLKIVFAGLAAIFLYNYFASLLRALGNSMVPLLFLALSAGLNIALDLWFVCGLGRDVGGAAEATVIAQYVSGVGISVYTWVRFPLVRQVQGQPHEGDRRVLGADLHPAIHHELRDLGRAGVGQQLWHGGHGGVCSGGQNRRLCLSAGAGFRQCVLHLYCPELRRAKD
jgi:Na+-driven multidrug efflux pump